MANARYWRLVSIQPYGGASLELSALLLQGTSGPLTGTWTCSHEPVSGTLSNLQDGNSTTLCTFSAEDVRSSGFALVFDAGAAAAVEGVIFGSGADRATFVAAAGLQASTDGASWGAAQAIRAEYPGALSLTPVLRASDSIAPLLRGNQRDESFYASAISLSGAVWVPGADPFGGAALNTAGGWATMAGNPNTQLGTNDWTLEFWCRRKDSARGLLVGLGKSPSGVFAALRVDSFAGGISVYWSNPAGNEWATFALDGVGTLPFDTWSYVEVTRSGGTVFVAINGNHAGSYAIGAAAMFSSDRFTEIGAITDWADKSIFNGLIGPVRFTNGVALRGSGGPLPVPTTVFAPGPPALPTRTVASVADVAVSSPVGAATMGYSRMATARDVEFGGPGRIWGTVETEIAANTKVPAKARISILRQRDRLLARETWSDPVTGAWEVQGLDTSQQFIALAQDPTGAYRPVAADQTAPEAAP